MKIAEYNDMMAYLTRPGFSGGSKKPTVDDLKKSGQIVTGDKYKPKKPKYIKLQEIIDFELRNPRKTKSEGGPLVPEPKPYTLEEFQERADLLIKGALGGFPKDEMINKLQIELDKVQESGTLSKEEAINFINERTQQLKEYIKNNPGETLPELETRENFVLGGPADLETIKDLYNQGKSQDFIADQLGPKAHRSDVARAIKKFKEEGVLKDRDILKVTKQNPKYLKNAKKFREIVKKEIKDFNEKEKVLPNEKYLLNLLQIGKKMGGMSQKKVQGLLDSVKDLDFELVTQGGSSPTKLTPKQQKYYKENYKTQTIAQMVRKLTGQGIKSKKGTSMYGALERLKNTLIKRNLIDPKDIQVGINVIGGPSDLGYKRKGPEAGFRVYQAQQERLAKLNPKEFIDNPKYFGREGKFSQKVLDSQLLKFLNMDTVKGSLDPKLPKFIKPSYEHIQGITPGDIIKDSEALRKVDLASRRYNFKEMGAKSNLYRDIKNYLRTAQAAIDGNQVDLANDALKVVNEVYDTVVKRFPNFDRKELPNYSLEKGVVKETNLKGLIEPKKVEDSFKSYFKNVADTVTPSELERIKKIQPNVGKVVDLYKEGKSDQAYKFIKERVPKIIDNYKPGMVNPRPAELFSNPFADPATLGKYGKYALQIAGTPLGVGVLTAGFGVDPSSAIDRVALGAEAALAPTLVKGAAEVATNPVTQRILNLGLSPQMAMRAARVAQPLGVASLVGEGLYQLGKRGAAEKAKLDAMTPFQKQQYLAGEVEPLMDEGGIVDISREGFADGPEDPSKRKFMKVMGGLTALPFVGKFFKVAERAAPIVDKIKTTDLPGKPEWFDALVNKVIREGTDMTKQFATKEREIVHATKISEDEFVRVHQDLETGSVRVDYDSPFNMGEETVSLEFRPGIADETTKGKPRDEFQATEVEPRYVGGPEDADMEFDGIGGGSSIKMLESDVSNLEKYATGKNPTMKEFVDSKKRKDRVKAINEDQLEAAEYISGKYGDGPEPDYDDFIDE